jgi:hypothetical protein
MAPHGHAVDRATVRQKKTGQPVRFEMTEQTREAIDNYIRAANKKPGQHLFTGRRGCDRAITTRQYARLVGKTDAVILMLKRGGAEGNGSKSVEQRVPLVVPLVWTRCHLGGARRWFRCSASVGGRPCGRQVAKLYLRGHVFAYRHCFGLAYASQQEVPRHRAISQVQKLRMRLRGSANLTAPFPARPRGMHRWT